MSTLRFEAEYVTGQKFSKELDATVNSTASLTISRTLNFVLTASVIEGATLQRTEVKQLSASVSESSGLSKIVPPVTFTAGEGVVALVNKQTTKTFTANVTESAVSAVHGASYTKIFTVATSEQVVALGTLRGKTFSPVMAEAASLTRLHPSFMLLTRAVNIAASMSKLRQLKRTFTSGIVEAATVLYIRTMTTRLNAFVIETAGVNLRRTRIMTTSLAEVASLQRAEARGLAASLVAMGASLTKRQTLARTLPVIVTEGASLVQIKVQLKTFMATEIMTATARGVPTKFLVAMIVEVAGLNKKGKYHGPPAVLQLYDLTDSYQLPALQGATVSYVHGTFGAGVMFDIYAAYILAGGAFYVADNGLKQALDQHPAVARIF